MNLNHLHDSVTDISLLILYDVYVTFEKKEKIYNFEKKKTFFFEKYRGNLISQIADFRKFRGNLILQI